jgi:hypothetical protein
MPLAKLFPELSQHACRTSYQHRKCSACTQTFKGRSLLYQRKGQRLQEICFSCVNTSNDAVVQRLAVVYGGQPKCS